MRPLAHRRGPRAIPRYSVYGLTLASNAELFGLPPAHGDSAPEVSVTLDGAPLWRAAAAGGSVRYQTPRADAREGDGLVVRESREGFHFRYADGTEFHVSRDGRAIWAAWPRTSTLADTATYLLGPVLGFAQRLMGILALHASAVVVGGVAVALAGPAYAGKSTMAGAFAAAGHAVLADDMTSLRERDGRAIAHPAYDHLRLWTDSERMLLGTSGRLPRLTPTWDKRALQLARQGWEFREAPAPLAAVCVLAAREQSPLAPRVEAIAPGAAFVAIAANSYANYLLDDEMRSAEFGAITRLLGAVRVLRVTPHSDPARLGALVGLVTRVIAA